MRSHLYIIERVHHYPSHRTYWNCSSEHGAGWNEDYPKQAFSQSELTREITRLAEAGDIEPGIIIHELGILTYQSRNMVDTCETVARMPHAQPR